MWDESGNFPGSTKKDHESPSTSQESNAIFTCKLAGRCLIGLTRVAGTRSVYVMRKSIYNINVDSRVCFSMLSVHQVAALSHWSIHTKGS